MTATEAGNLSSAFSAILTAYIASRTLFIWYRYLRRTSGAVNQDTIRGIFKRRSRQSPPPAFPAADLPIATMLLVITSVLAVGFYVWGLMHSGTASSLATLG